MDFLYLVPVALALGAMGLAAFMWSLKSDQYEDLDGAAERILAEDDDKPIVGRPTSDGVTTKTHRKREGRSA